jgi:hypothetical protein
MEDELEDVIYRMQITKLESKLALREIERESHWKSVNPRGVCRY